MVRAVWLLIAAALSSTLLVADPTEAQQRPRYGGELVFPVPSEPPSYDGHREGTFGTVHPLAPHYNTLLRMDPTDRTGTRPVPDLAESWTISPDGMTYTLKLRQGVKFHDGSGVTSRDVKASYDKIIFPPAGIISARKGTYQAVEAVEAPDPPTVRFRLKWPEASFLVNLASPYSWIYKADILAKDMRWYETNVMGTGPFKFVEHVKGSHWVGKKNPDYWDKGKPYLDGYRALFMSASSAQVAAIRGGARAHPVPRLEPGGSRRARAGAGVEDHRAGEPLGLRRAGGDEPRAEALRRQARPAGIDPGPRPLRGLAQPLPHRGGEGGRRASRCRGRRGPRRHRSWRSSPATAATSRPAGRRRAGSSARPASPRASPSRSRIAGFPSRTRRWGSG